MKTPIAGLADFAALDPFFRIIEEVVATGAPYGNRYISVITLRDREIVHWRDYLDPVAVFDALGWPAR